MIQGRQASKRHIAIQRRYPADVELLEPRLLLSGAPTFVEYVNPINVHVTLSNTVTNSSATLTQLTDDVPVPINWLGQQFSNVSVTPADAVLIHGDDGLCNAYRVYRTSNLPGPGQSLTTTVQYDARLSEVRSDEQALAAYDFGPYDTSTDQYGLFTAAEPELQTDDWRIAALGSHFEAQYASPYLRARAIYDFVVDHMTYVFPNSVPNDAVGALLAGQGQCDHYAKLFTALCRAADVPAWYASGVTGGHDGSTDTGAHGWSGILLPDGTQLPVDATWGDLEDVEDRDFWFGNQDTGRITNSREINVDQSSGIGWHQILGSFEGYAWWQKSSGSDPTQDNSLTQTWTDPVALITNIFSLGTWYAGFGVDYYDDAGIDQSTIDNNDIRVVAPGGAILPAECYSTTASNGGKEVTAWYSIDPPGGAWTAANSGDYFVTALAGQVKNLSGVAVPADVTHSFAIQYRPQVLLSDACIVEPTSGQASLVFTARLSAPSDHDVTVAYATADGSAVHGQDYTASSGTVTFAAGETTQTFSVPVLSDATSETMERFGVVLSDPAGATLGQTRADGIIIGDHADAAPTLTTMNALGVGLPGGPVTITYDMLAAAGNEADADGDPLSFWIGSVDSGTLTKSGLPIEAAQTMIGPGESVVWQPSGSGNAFKVQAWDGFALSGTSVQVKYQTDAVPPTVAITDISPDPRTTAVSSVTITFSEPVTGFGLADLSLTRNGGANLLTASQTLSSGNGGMTWTLGNLTGLTGTVGAYTLTLTATNAGITDASDNALASGDSDSWAVNDGDDQATEATAVAIGSTVLGNTIDIATDVDLFAVTVTAGQRLCFDIDRPSGSLDSYIRLFNSAGSQLAGSNNAPAPGEAAGTDSYLEYTFTSAGTYYLGVSGNGNSAYSIVSGNGDAAAGSTGPYTLVVTQDADPDDTIPTATPVAIGSTVTGKAIDTATDEDLFAVTVTTGQRLCFDIDRPSGTLDSFIRLFNSAGSQLAGSNNAPAPGEAASTDSYLEYTFASAGTYYLGVSGNGNSVYSIVSGAGDASSPTTGAYTLIVTQDSDPDDTVPTAAPVAIGSTATGKAIDTATDVDLYSVTVTAGQRLCFDIDRPSGTLDSYIRLFNSAGSQLAGSNNAPAPGEAATTDSYLEYTFATAGTYYLGVSGALNNTYSIVSGANDTAAGSTGAYTLTVTLDVDPDDTIAAAVATTVNSTKSNSIDTTSDVDLFAFTVTAGQKVSFDIDRPSGTLDSYIRLFNSAGMQLAGSNNAPAPGEAATTDSYLAYTFATAGTYYLGVSAASNNAYSIVSGLGHSNGLTAGLYTLTLALVA